MKKKLIEMAIQFNDCAELAHEGPAGLLPCLCFFLRWIVITPLLVLYLLWMAIMHSGDRID